MPILTAPPTPAQIAALTPDQIKAAQQKDAQHRASLTVAIANNAFNALLQSINQGLATIWEAPAVATDSTIQARLDALQTLAKTKGDTAKTAFDANAATLALLETLHPGCTTSIAALALVKPFTTNSDGSVTVT